MDDEIVSLGLGLLGVVHEWRLQGFEVREEAWVRAVCPGERPGGGTGKTCFNKPRRSWKSLGNPLRVSNSLENWPSNNRTTPTATRNNGKFWMSSGIDPGACRSADASRWKWVGTGPARAEKAPFFTRESRSKASRTAVLGGNVRRAVTEDRPRTPPRKEPDSDASSGKGSFCKG